MGFAEGEIPERLAVWKELFHPEDAEIVFTAIRKFVAGELWDPVIECRLRHRERGWGRFSMRVALSADSVGRPVIVSGCLTDISQSSETIRTLRVSDDRTRHALDATRDGLWDWDIVTGEVYFSPQWCRMLGYEPGEVPARVEFFFQILHPDDSSSVGKKVEEHLAGLTVVKQDDVRLRMKTGEYRWFLDRGRVVSRDADGRPLRMAGTITDITEKKKYERSITAYSRLANELNRVNSVTEAGEIIGKAADELIGWDATVMVMFNPADDSCHSILNIDLVDGVRKRVPVIGSDERLSARMRETREHGARLVLRRDPAELVDYINSEGQSCKPCASLMFVPIRDGDSTVGMLSIQSYAIDAYGPSDLATLQTLADQCGGALSRIISREALRESESWLRVAQSLSHIGNFRWDARTGKLNWSEELFRIYGRDPLRFKPDFEAYIGSIHPDDRERIAGTLGEVMRTQGSFNHDYRLQLPDGSIKWVGARGRALTDADGNLIGIEGTCQDVTERKQVESSLRQSEEKFRTLFENSGDAIFLMQGELFVDCNARTLSMFGCESRNQILGKPPHLFSPEIQSGGRDSVSLAREKIDAALAGEPQFFEWTHTRLDGSQFPAEVGLIVLELGDRRFLQAIVRDSTERNRLEEQLRQSHKMEAIGLLAGGVAHDFNNLLTVINGFCEVLMSQQEPTNPQWESLAAIREAGDRAASLTAQLLAFSRKAIVEPKVVDLNDQLETTFRMLRRLIGAHIRLESHLSAELDKVRVDPTQFDQVIMNLAVNAHDAMPKGGVLTITTRNVRCAGEAGPARFVQLTVTDTGMGMSDEIRSRIFEPFYTTKGMGKGTGLGLATVHGIINQAGGTISVESEPGIGTTFRILIPSFVAPAERERTDAEVVAGPRGAETILLAEDETSVRRLAKLSLEMHGYTVLEADGGPRALEVALAHPGNIDLLISDVVMPEQGGRDLADEIRRTRPGIAVMFVSGYTDDDILRHGVEVAREAFLQKPFTSRSLARKVREVLDSAKETPG